MTDIVALLAMSFPLSYSPGPGNSYFAAVGARHGVTGTLPANIGYHLTAFAIMLGIGLVYDGIATLSPTILGALRIGGSAYVLYLAWVIATAEPSKAETTQSSARFIDGALLMLLNPKAYLIIGVIFTQFLRPDDGDHRWRALWITSVFIAQNFLAFHVWAYAGSALAARFRHPQHARILNQSLGIVLAVVAVWMLLT